LYRGDLIKWTCHLDQVAFQKPYLPCTEFVGAYNDYSTDGGIILDVSGVHTGNVRSFSDRDNLAVVGYVEAPVNTSTGMEPAILLSSVTDLGPAY
jgi:hypothetical protein